MRFMLGVLMVAAVAIVSSPSTASALNVPMKLDPSFGTGGRTIVDIAGPVHEDEPFSLLMKPDGKFVLPGKAVNPVTGNYDFAILQFTKNGARDTSFSGDGVALLDFFGARDEALAVVVQADGKLVAGGFARGAPTGSDFALARFNANGSLDTSFGVGGRVTTDFFGGDDGMLDLKIQPDGKLVAAGAADSPSAAKDFALARYNADGSLDASFGSGGKVTTDFFGTMDAGNRMLLQPDGKVVVVGTALNPGTNGSDFAYARYNVDGTLDSSFATFGADGIGTTDFFGTNDTAYAVALQTDGKLIIAGLSYNPHNASQDAAIARYNADGSLDTSYATYGAPGIGVVDLFGMYDQILALAIQPDGKVIGAGHAQHPTRSFEFLLLRFLPSGELDNTFGINGRLTTDFFGGPDGIHGIALQADGRAVVAGDALNFATGGDDFVIARYLVADSDWAQAVVSGLPPGDFSSATAKAEILARFDAVEADLAANKRVDAVAKLVALRGVMNGCGVAPDGNDLLATCLAQYKVRVLLEQIIYKLGGG